MWFTEKRNDLGLQKWKIVAERGKEIATNISAVKF